MPGTIATRTRDGPPFHSRGAASSPLRWRRGRIVPRTPSVSGSIGDRSLQGAYSTERASEFVETDLRPSWRRTANASTWETLRQAAPFARVPVFCRIELHIVGKPGSRTTVPNRPDDDHVLERISRDPTPNGGGETSTEIGRVRHVGFGAVSARTSLHRFAFGRTVPVAAVVAFSMRERPHCRASRMSSA